MLLRERNFFGTLQVNDSEVKNDELHNHVLKHGRITHGLQYVSEEKRHIPTTYYSPQSGVGRTIGFYRQNKKLHGMRIGAVGLGTGTLAAYAEQGDSIRFYEINPAVIEITEPGQWFTYLKDCKARGGNYDIVLGDARLTLERELQNHRAAEISCAGAGRLQRRCDSGAFVDRRSDAELCRAAGKGVGQRRRRGAGDSYYESVCRSGAGGARAGGEVWIRLRNN